MSDATSPPTRVRPRELAYEDRYQKIWKQVAEFGPLQKEYFILDRGTRAAALVARGDEILLVRQYRFAVNRVCLEIPSGRVDEGEDPKTAAARECVEETGVEPRLLEPLIRFEPGVDTVHHPSHIFSTEVFDEPKAADPETVRWTKLDECVRMVFAGEIVDSLSVIAILAWRHRREGR